MFVNRLANKFNRFANIVPPPAVRSRASKALPCPAAAEVETPDPRAAISQLLRQPPHVGAPMAPPQPVNEQNFRGVAREFGGPIFMQHECIPVLERQDVLLGAVRFVGPRQENSRQCLRMSAANVGMWLKVYKGRHRESPCWMELAIRDVPLAISQIS